MKEKLEQLKQEVVQTLESVKERSHLEDVRTEFLGRKGKLASLMKEMAALADEERKVIGQLANEVKSGLEDAFTQKEQVVASHEENARAEQEWIDISEPGAWPQAGHLHPTSQAIAEVTDIFSRIGFVRMPAPEIDWDYYAFETLNMPPDHPARDDWETFFIADNGVQKSHGEKGRIVLTPHTSNSQVRVMEKHDPPIRMINIGRCFRRQSDVSHVPMFHQFEGLMIDKGLTIAHLKGVIEYFAKTFFGPERQIRLRPHHFRFTEPSFEVDISCDACGGDANCRLCKGGWLELGGAGMVHPNVLKAGGVDPNTYTGFAFGWGIERTYMMRGGMQIDDLRILYKNDLRFVRQF